MNNIPVHAPLYTPTLTYGSNDCESLSALVEVDERVLRDLLNPTPFEYIAPYAWVEIVVLKDTFGVAPFASGGVIVPARHSASGVIGGYYAFCYIDTDEALALGREPFGYPKKHANITLKPTPTSVRGQINCGTAKIKIDMSREGRTAPSVLPPKYPHLLLQVIPAAESAEILLKRVIARDTTVQSTFTAEYGEGTTRISPGRQTNELAWLAESRTVAATYATGEFRSAYGRVLQTVEVGAELRRDLPSAFRR
jgi:acetoacetate decarboxylase